MTLLQAFLRTDRGRSLASVAVTAGIVLGASPSIADQMPAVDRPYVDEMWGEVDPVEVRVAEYEIAFAGLSGLKDEMETVHAECLSTTVDLASATDLIRSIADDFSRPPTERLASMTKAAEGAINSLFGSPEDDVEPVPFTHASQETMRGFEGMVDAQSDFSPILTEAQRISRLNSAMDTMSEDVEVLGQRIAFCLAAREDLVVKVLSVLERPEEIGGETMANRIVVSISSGLAPDAPVEAPQTSTSIFRIAP